jgi:hypothetical protein
VTCDVQLLLGTVVAVILIMMTVKTYMDAAVLPKLGVAGSGEPKKKKKKDKKKAEQGDTWEILR